MRWLRWFPAVVVVVTAFFIFSWSLLQPGMFQIHDYTQVGRLVELRRGIENGHIPAVWSQNFGYGYGMPLFLFYGPLPYYIATVATWLGWSDIGSIKLMFILSNLLGMAGVWLWFSKKGLTSALTAAVVFLAMPYRALDIFVRGALNEVLAISLLPWILVSARLIITRPRLGMALAAVTTASLLLTHNITSLLGIPIIGGLGFIWIYLETRRFLPLLHYMLGHLLGAVLAAFFVLPSVLENKLTAIDSILTGYFDFRLHFLSHRQLVIEDWGFGGSQIGLDDGISFHLGAPILLALLFASAWILRIVVTWLRAKAPRTFNHLPKSWIWIPTLVIASVASVFMTIGRSQPLWELLPLISLAQFPWRFLAISSVTTAILCGELVRAQTKWFIRWTLAALFLMLTLNQAQFHRPERFLRNPDRYYSSDDEFIRSELSKTLPDFLPKNFNQDLPPVAPEQRIMADAQVLTPVVNKPHVLEFSGENAAGKIVWNIADFPGWQYEVNGTVVQPELLDDGRRQHISNEAIESVGARFVSTPLRTTAQFISLAGLGVLALLLLPWQTIMRKSRNHHVANY